MNEDPENDGWLPIEDAPKDGTKILVWCDAAESLPGIVEMYWCRHKRWFEYVVSHPFPNVCPRPTRYRPTFKAPK